MALKRAIYLPWEMEMRSTRKYWRILVMLVVVSLSGSVSFATKPVPESEHPLLPVLETARGLLQRMEQVEDYTCTLVTRERIRNELRDYQWIYAKLRHEQTRGGQVEVPFSVYLRFLGPDDVAGREVLYRQGAYGGKMIVRRGGLRFPYVTVSITPDGDLAMQDNRYPLTEIGIKNMLKRLIEVGEEDLKYGECEVEYFGNAKIDGRACTAVRITHPVRRSHFRYHVAEIYVDNELQVPVRYASYDWPEEEGGPPRLLEDYTYTKIQFNVGLKDRDFDYRNPAYEFRKDFQP
jgi:hypothetical protein